MIFLAPALCASTRGAQITAKPYYRYSFDYGSSTCPLSLVLPRSIPRNAWKEFLTHPKHVELGVYALEHTFRVEGAGAASKMITDLFKRYWVTNDPYMILAYKCLFRETFAMKGVTVKKNLGLPLTNPPETKNRIEWWTKSIPVSFAILLGNPFGNQEDYAHYLVTRYPNDAVAIVRAGEICLLGAMNPQLTKSRRDLDFLTFDNAISYFKEAKRLAPQVDVLDYEIADCYQRENEHSKAVPFFSSFIKKAIRAGKEDTQLCILANEYLNSSWKPQ